MSKMKRTFSPEFKQDAASLILDKGYTYERACEVLHVGNSTLSRWVSQLKQERNGQTPKSKALTAEQQEIQRLQKRIKDLELDKEILKKATALLMSEPFKSMR